jgi:hypothetical protein
MESLAKAVKMVRDVEARACRLPSGRYGSAPSHRLDGGVGTGH